MSDDPPFDATNLVRVLRQWCDAYPEAVFATPPKNRRAKDAAAADVMRQMALPVFAACADRIEELEALLSDCRYHLFKNKRENEPLYAAIVAALEDTDEQ